MPRLNGHITGIFGHPHHDLILRWFDPSGYLLYNKDVAERGGGQTAVEYAEYHFVQTGFDERRVYCPQLIRGFETEYYRAQLPPEFKRATQYELFGHWLYQGLFEGLAPNEPTDDALDSTFHVFSPGRVASYAVAHALQDAGCMHVLHGHSNFEFSRAYPGSSLTYEQLVTIKTLDTHRSPLTFISGIRDPFDWVISAIARSVERAESPRPESQAEAISFVRRSVGRLLRWFSHQYFQGIDVYATPFDAERGFATITKGRTRVVLYRADKLSSLAPTLEEELGVSPFRVRKINESRAGQVIANLVRHIPPDLCAAVIASPYVTHFFTERERHDMEARWKGSCIQHASAIDGSGSAAVADV